jgi:hypothetical protein
MLRPTMWMAHSRSHDWRWTDDDTRNLSMGILTTISGDTRKTLDKYMTSDGTWLQGGETQSLWWGSQYESLAQIPWSAGEPSNSRLVQCDFVVDYFGGQKLRDLFQGEGDRETKLMLRNRSKRRTCVPNLSGVFESALSQWLEWRLNFKSWNVINYCYC